MTLKRKRTTPTKQNGAASRTCFQAMAASVVRQAGRIALRFEAMLCPRTVRAAVSEPFATILSPP